MHLNCLIIVFDHCITLLANCIPSKNIPKANISLIRVHLLHQFTECHTTISGVKACVCSVNTVLQVTLNKVMLAYTADISRSCMKASWTLKIFLNCQTSHNHFKACFRHLILIWFPSAIGFFQLSTLSNWARFVTSVTRLSWMHHIVLLQGTIHALLQACQNINTTAVLAMQEFLSIGLPSLQSTIL